MSTNNNNLATTITVNGDTYIVNAETANQVVNSLIINKIDIEGNTISVDAENGSVSFNGSSAKSLNIVPSEGGKFTGPVHIGANTESNTEFPDEAILNYADIKGVLLNNLFNNSVAYCCNNDGTISPNVSDKSLDSLSIIYGNETGLKAFADKNKENKEIPAYIFICTEIDSGATTASNNIYFGTYENEPTRLATNSELADKAKKLESTSTFITNLAYDAAVAFDGEKKDKDVVLGVTGTLSVANGGTGETSLDDVLVGKAKTLNTSRNIQTNLASTSAASFNGSAAITPGVTGTLGVANGGTGQTSLSSVTVGKSNATKITFKSSADAPAATIYPAITISSVQPVKPNEGDIWIQI
jgi:hypothetical protein